MKTICHWNLNGFYSKRELLEIYLNNYNVDIICLNETKPTARTTFNIEGYTVAARRDRATHTGGGGVAILVRNHIDCTDLEVDADDICAITLSINRQKTCIISCYWGFAHTSTPNLDKLKELLENHRNTILLGDFNAYHTSWGHKSVNNRGKELKKLTKEFDLHILNNTDEATFFNHTTDNHRILDLAMMSKPARGNLGNLEVDEPIFGELHYHCPLRLSVRTSVKDHPIWAIKSLRNCDWDRFQRETASKVSQLPQLTEISTTREIDHLVSQLTSSISSSLHKSCPTKKFRGGLHRISQELRDRIKLKHELQREIRQHPDYLPLRQAHRELVREIKSRLAREKRAQVEASYGSLDPTKSKTYWKDLKRLTKPKVDRKPARLVDPTTKERTTSDKATADTFAGHLSSVHRVHQDTFFDHTHKQEVDNWAEANKELLTSLDTPKEAADPYSRPITAGEVTALLSRCKNDTSPGEDTIPYIALKSLPGIALDMLVDIYNHCLRRGYFPLQWKHALGTMILKPQKPKGSATSYRPINLLNCMGKLFEKVIATRIQEFADDTNLLNTWQRAYQPRKEANEHIHIINQYLEKAKTSKKTTALLLIDIEKAFDAVWHNGLLKKLHSQNIPPDLLRIVASFLRDRTIQVRTGTTLSEKVHLLAGTPQGSILSPLLFILYVNDIPTMPPCQCTQYADDIGIYTSHRNHNYLRSQLQRQIDHLERWCEQWFIKLNPKKTQLVQITTKRTRTALPVTIRNSPIDTTDEATLLGSTFDRKMSRLPLIASIKRKTEPRIKLLQELTDSGVPKEGLRTFYLSMIRPLLETGYHLTHDHKPSTVALEKIQNRCLRVITWSSNRASTRGLQENLRVPSVREHLQSCRQKALRRYQDSSLQDHLNSILETV